MFNRRKEGESRKIAECIAEPPTLTVARSPVGGGPALPPREPMGALGCGSCQMVEVLSVPSAVRKGGRERDQELIDGA